jgi:hypothetical protein
LLRGLALAVGIRGQRRCQQECGWKYGVLHGIAPVGIGQ